MKRQAYAKRRDANEPAIVKALMAMGASVVRLDQPCDLLVGYRRQCYLIEVKMPDSKLNKLQTEFWESWRGPAVHIVHDVDEAMDVLLSG